MKVTRLGRPVPILNLGYGATTQTPTGGTAGNVLTATGSNSSYWGENIARITANGSNASPLVGPYVNISAGSNVTFAWASNSLTVNVLGVGLGGGVGGGLVLLEQKTASASATLDFTTCISSAYDEYMIEFVEIWPATTGVNFVIRMSTNGGSTYDATGLYAYEQFIWRAAASAVFGATAQTEICLNHNGGGNTISTAVSGIRLNGYVRLFDPLSTTVYKTIQGKTSNRDTAGFRINTEIKGSYESTTAVNAFRFLLSSGNIASGTIRVYGLAK